MHIYFLLFQLKNNRTYFEKYYKVNTVMLEDATEQNCDDICQRFHYCAADFQDYDLFEQCVQSNSNSFHIRLFEHVIFLIALALVK